MPLQIIIDYNGTDLIIELFEGMATATKKIEDFYSGGRADFFVSLEQPDYTKGRRPPDRGAKRRSQRQERKLAHDIGGRAQPGSGSQPGAKGDIRKRGEARVESKFTQAKSYRVERKTLDKIRGEAAFGEVPSLDIEFQDPAGRPEDRWVLIPYDIWKERYAAGND